MNTNMETPSFVNESFIVSPEKIKENIMKLTEIRDSISRSPEFKGEVEDLNKTITNLEVRLASMQN